MLNLIDARDGGYVFSFACPCGRTSLFAARAPSEAEARDALWVSVVKHIWRENA